MKDAIMCSIFYFTFFIPMSVLFSQSEIVSLSNASKYRKLFHAFR